MKSRLLIAMIAGLSIPVCRVCPQSDDNIRWESVLEELLSDEDLTPDSREDLQSLYESVHYCPLNINTATKEELSVLPFLTYRQIEDIHAYIYMHGPMLTLGELQLTGSLDYGTRRLLRQFVYAGEIPEKAESLKLKDVLEHGRSEIAVRMDYPLYLRDGFRHHSAEELKRYPNRQYLGSRLSHSLRYSFNWQNRIRLGFTADQDAGEPFAGRNSAGYDYWSPYLYIKDIGVVREAVIGNFKAKFGYGLLLGGGFSIGKNMSLSSMEKNTQGIKPHSSTQEYGYLSGAGLALGWNRFTSSFLGASTPLDATLKGDTLISSFKQDGLHRTQLEWSKKRNIRQKTMAVNVRYSYRGFHAGVTAIHDRLSLPYNGIECMDGLSCDLSLNRARYALAAEFSVLNGKRAFLTSHTFRLPGNWTLNSVFRSYAPGYMAIHANSLAESGVENETGILTAFSRSGGRLKLSGYMDMFMHPEPRYGVSESSNGIDIKAEADWRVGHRDRILLTGRLKSKQKDCRYTGQLEYCIRARSRICWTHSLKSGMELKTQLLYSRYDFIAEPVSNGLALIGSWSGSICNGQADFAVTTALFSTDSNDSSLSVYEKGLRYTYNYISLYGKGARASATVRFRLSNDIQLYFKAGSTLYTDRNEIGQAQQRIPSGHKEDVSLQLIAKF